MNNIDRNNVSFERDFNSAEGNMIHENMKCTEEEKELIRLRYLRLISEEEFIKRIYKDSLIIFIKNNKYYCIKEDKDIFKICKNNISEVRKNKINYLIIDNLVVIESHFYKDNNYNKYKMLIIVMKVLEMVYDYVFNKK